MRISVSSYSFEQYRRAGKLDLPGMIRQAAEMGFEGIEFTDLPKDLPTEERFALARDLKEDAARAGIAIAAYAVGANLWQPDPEKRAAEVERLKGEVDLAAELGAPVMRHDLVWALDKTGAGRSFLGMMPGLAKCTREITRYAAGKGIRTCSENHGLIAQDSTRMEAFAAAVNEDNYGLLVDLGNFLCVDEDPAHAVSRVANFAFHVHAKDFIINAENGEYQGMTRGMNRYLGVAVGDGCVPVKQCLSILKHAGYDGWVTVEFEGREDCLTGIRKGLDRLTGYLKEI